MTPPLTPAHPIGVHSHLFRGSPAAVAEACRRHGLACVQLTPSFPGLIFHDPGQFTPERSRMVIEPLHAAGIAIACVSGHGNLMDPDLDRRHRGILRLLALIRHCRDFGTDRVVTETGSLSPKSPWMPQAPRRSRESWDELRLILTEALDVATEHGVTLLLKPEPAQMLATAADALRLRDELAHPQLGFVMDPAHFLLGSSPEELRGRMEQVVELFGPWSPIVHLKDIAFEAGEASTPRVGQGILDYGLFLRLLDLHQPQAPLILEHLQPNEVAEVKTFLDRLSNSPPP